MWETKANLFFYFFFRFGNGEEYPPTEFMWEDNEFKLGNDSSFNLSLETRVSILYTYSSIFENY